jgi:hypothetical protein
MKRPSRSASLMRVDQPPHRELLDLGERGSPDRAPVPAPCLRFVECEVRVQEHGFRARNHRRRNAEEHRYRVDEHHPSRPAGMPGTKPEPGQGNRQRGVAREVKPVADREERERPAGRIRLVCMSPEARSKTPSPTSAQGANGLGRCHAMPTPMAAAAPAPDRSCSAEEAAPLGSASEAAPAARSPTMNAATHQSERMREIGCRKGIIGE